MEDVLDLYEEAYDPARPVVCFDELPYQLLGETRAPIPAEPGRLERRDYEYERKGTANLFIHFEPKAGWRHAEATETRTKTGTRSRVFAHQMRALADVHYPEAELIRVVLDQLNTHTGASLYEAFEPEEAKRILGRLEFRHTPKHGSWLNQAEIEWSVLSGQCLDRRIPDKETLESEIDAWEQERNRARATVEWRSTWVPPARSCAASTHNIYRGASYQFGFSVR